MPLTWLFGRLRASRILVERPLLHAPQRKQNSVQQRMRARRASGDVYIHRNHGIHTANCS